MEGSVQVDGKDAQTFYRVRSDSAPSFHSSSDLFSSAPSTNTKIRTEYFDDAMTFSEAFEYASQFYAGTTSAGDVDQACLFALFIVLADSLAAITDFPKPVVVVLACTL